MHKAAILGPATRKGATAAGQSILQKASIIEAERGTATSGRTNLTSGVAFFATSDGDDDDDEAMKRVMNASGRGWVNEDEERQL